MILNVDRLCPVCGVEVVVASKSKTCETCSITQPRGKSGRPQRYTDDQILDAVESGDDTADKLLKTFDMRSKTNLLTRVRRMRDAGLVTLVERKRCEGFTIISERSEQ